MNKAACFALFGCIVGFCPMFGQGEKSPLLELKVHENVETRRAELRLRLRSPAEILKLEASADGKILPVEFHAFGAEGTIDTGALLFLIDKSDPKRGRAIEAAKALAMQTIERSAPHTDSAVYAFDANLTLVADFGAPWADVAERLSSVRAAGLATELYRNLLEAIAILEKRPVERRAVVLFSDGKAEDTTYTLAEVVEAAQKASVAIFSVGYAERPQETVHLQSLRRLAAETGGLFAEADARTRNVPDEFPESVHALLRSGGFAKVDLSENQSGRKVQLTIHLAGSEPVQQSFPLIKLAPQAPGPVPIAPDPKVGEVASKVAEMAEKVEAVAKQVADVPAKIEEVTTKAAEARRAAEEQKAAEAKRAAEARAAEAAVASEEDAAREAANQKFRTMLASGLGLALAAGAALFFFMRSPAAAPATGPVFARLQVLDSGGTEHLMRTTALRVGRGRDNDLTLGNDSVSRHHAEISRTREGEFTITELNAGNGVLVNGKAVEKATLQNEDIIELGEVRIRFLVG